MIPVPVGGDVQQISSKALVVDLDGTLVRTDLLHESVWQTLCENPKNFFSAIWSFVRTRNRAKFKFAISSGFDLKPEALPYNEEVLSVIQEYRSSGRPVILASASTDSQVKEIAKYLGLFDYAVGSSEAINLSGRAKVESIAAYLGTSDFTYIGNSKVDLRVWAACSTALIVSSSKNLETKARQVNEDVTVLGNNADRKISTWAKQLRIYQWLKNLLIFVPILAAFQPWSLETTLSLFGAFVSFSFVASSVYLVNDLFDLANDRMHATKKYRPIAQGRVLPLHGLAAALALALLGLAIGILIQPLFGVMVAIYLCLTLAYSKRWKSIALVDAIILAVLYTVRVIAGGLVAEIPISYWLLSFSVFFFLSLAWVKRYAELQAGVDLGKDFAPGRAYTTKDLPIIQSFGISSGFLAIMIFALYLDSPLVSQNYSTPAIAWLAIPLLVYLLSRIWLLAHRGEVHEDPLTFVITDKQSLASIGMIGLTLFAAHIGVGF